MIPVKDSYAHCERVARARARNFYYSFLLLPAPKRRAMCAIYAFMRQCDDLSDGENASIEGVRSWAAELDRTLAGEPAEHPVWPAFLDTVRRFKIPGQYFHEMIEGVSSDFSRHTLATFSDLYRYCYLVASVVGLTVTHIFEFEDPAALELAEKCGIAFQLTNILRDVREDHESGRVYLPEEDLHRFDVRSLDKSSIQLKELLRFEGDRARSYFDQSRPLLGLVHSDSRAALWALMEIYRRLLERMEASGYDVLAKRFSLSTPEKLAILVEAWLRGGAPTR